MDEYDAMRPPQEHTPPAWESEFNPPAWDGEFSVPSLKDEYAPPAPEEPKPIPPEDEKRPGGSSRVRRLLRYGAAAVVTGMVVLTAAPAEPAEPEIVDVESYIAIECCGVTQDEPDVLRFRYMDYRSVYEDVPTYRDEDFHFLLVDPDGQETELTREKDPDLYRAVYCAEDEDVREAAYSAVEFEGSYFNLNTGCEMWRADVGEVRPGSTLKIVCAYESEGVIKRMTSEREIVKLPLEMERSVTADVAGSEETTDLVGFSAVLHPTTDYGYVLGDLALSRMSFCTRWYDAQGNSLGEGWCFAAPTDAEWPFPEVYLSGGDYVFSYYGTVRKAAADPAAAYYTLELMVIEETTGWPYRIESEKIPIAFKAVPTPTPSPEPKGIVVESGKDAFDFTVRFPESDWSVFENDSGIVILAPDDSKALTLFSVDSGPDLIEQDLVDLLNYRYMVEVRNNTAVGCTVQNPSEISYYEVNGCPGRSMTFEYIDPLGNLYRCGYVVWLSGTRLYGLNLMAPEPEYEQLLSLVDQMLATFTPFTPAE